MQMKSDELPSCVQMVFKSTPWWDSVELWSCHDFFNARCQWPEENFCFHAKHDKCAMCCLGLTSSSSSSLCLWARVRFHGKSRCLSSQILQLSPSLLSQKTKPLNPLNAALCISCWNLSDNCRFLPWISSFFK